ncbi:hypothetical protein ACTXT7_006351 [Hymenolepis weldensis]
MAEKADFKNRTETRFYRLSIPDLFLIPEARFRAFKITSKQAQSTCLFNGLSQVRE